MLRLVRIFVVLVGVLAGPNLAAAQNCSAQFDQMAFGTAMLAALPATGATSTIRISCTGTVGQTLRICPGTATGNVFNAAKSNYLKLNLFSDPSYTVALQTGVDITIDGTGNGTGTQPIYGRLVYNGSPFKSDVYQDGINLALTFTDVTMGPPCSGPAAAGRRPAVAVKSSVKAVAAKR